MADATTQIPGIPSQSGNAQPNGPDGPGSTFVPPIFPAPAAGAGGDFGPAPPQPPQANAGGDFGIPVEEEPEFVIEDICPCPDQPGPVYVPWPVPIATPALPPGVTLVVPPGEIPPAPGSASATAPPPVQVTCPPSQVVVVGKLPGGEGGGNVSVDVAAPDVTVTDAVPAVTVEAPPPLVIPAPQVFISLTVPGEGAPVVNVGPFTATATATGGAGGAGGAAGAGGSGGTAFGGGAFAETFGVAGTAAVSGGAGESPESIGGAPPLIAAPAAPAPPTPKTGISTGVVARIFGVPIPDFGTTDPCGAMQRIMNAVEHWVTTNMPTVFKALLQGTEKEATREIETFTADAPILFRWFIRWVLGFLVSGARFLIGTIAHGECTPAQLLPVLLTRWITNLLERWTGLKASGLDRTAGYWQQYLCPQGIPSAGQAAHMYLRGVITKDVWECWTRANDVHWKPAALNLEADRTRIGVHETLLLSRRNGWTKDRLNRALRDQGVLHPEEGDEFVAASSRWLNTEQSMRLYAMGGCDPSALLRYGYLDGLAEYKLTDCAKYARGEGWASPQLDDLWAGRWKWPSFHEMMIAQLRLAPGVAPPGLEITDEDLERAARVDGIPPFWRKRLLHLMRKPLSLRELRTGYIKGVFGREETRGNLLKLAFTDESIKSKLAEWDRERIDNGVKSEWGKAYLAGAISADELTQQLEKEGYFMDVISGIRDALQDRATIARRKAHVACVRKRFLRAEVLAWEAVALLVGQGVDAGRAKELVDEWSCLRQAKGKEQGAATLCQWAQDGLISPDVYRIRLLRLGYHPGDVEAMVEQCATKGARHPKQAVPKGAKLPSAPKAPKVPKKAPTKKEPGAKPPPAKRPLYGAAKAKADAAAAKAQKERERLDAALVKLSAISSQVTGNSQGEDLTGVKRAVDDAVRDYEVTPLGAVAILSAVIQGVKHAKLTDWRPDWSAALTLLDRRGDKPDKAG